MTDRPENTAESLPKRPSGKPFKPGFDPRRNIKGVPKDTLLMRKHMRQIAAELIGKDDTEMTRLDAMLRQLWTSRNPAHNKLALQVLDPKLLIEHHEVDTHEEKVVTFDYSKLIANTAPRPVGDSDAPGESESDLHGAALGQDDAGGHPGT
jgi:hypothetical protein